MNHKPVKPYIGDQSMINYLRAQGSSIPLQVAKMRIMGAIASPNDQLVPFQVFASFWSEETFPKFVQAQDSETFFEVLMGLWHFVEETARKAAPFLTPILELSTKEQAMDMIVTRLEELELGFIEGFWGGTEDMPMPSASAALIDHLSHEVEAFERLYQDLEATQELSLSLGTALIKEIKQRDEICIDSIQALLLLKSKKKTALH